MKKRGCVEGPHALPRKIVLPAARTKKIKRADFKKRTGGNQMRNCVRAIACLTAAWLGTPVAFAQVTDDVVKIGVLADMSGLYSDLSGIGSVAAAQMAVEDFGGKVLGKRIEVISADHQNKPDIGASIARRWFDLEQVDAIVDVPVSSIAFAVQEISRQRIASCLFRLPVHRI